LKFQNCVFVESAFSL